MTRIRIAFSSDSIVHTHARLALIHLVLVVYVLSTIYVAWRLVVVCFCKTVHVVRRRHLETRELTAWLRERAAQSLLARVALRSFVHAFPLHV